MEELTICDLQTTNIAFFIMKVTALFVFLPMLGFLHGTMSKESGNYQLDKLKKARNKRMGRALYRLYHINHCISAWIYLAPNFLCNEERVRVPYWLDKTVFFALTAAYLTSALVYILYYREKRLNDGDEAKISIMLDLWYRGVSVLMVAHVVYIDMIYVANYIR